MGGIKKGSPLSPEHRRKIGESLRKSVKHHEAMRRRSYHSHPRHIAETADSLRVKAMEKKLGVHCILITEGMLKRLVRESPTHQILCARRQCSGLLRVGDIVVPRGNQRYGKRKYRKRYYHSRCWESLFIDVED